MTASYPTSAKSFSTKVDNVDLSQAAHINDIQDEVAALETQLIAGGVSIATPTPTANAVPKADGAGKLAVGWMGLPASTNVLGNRSAAGEFIQRGVFAGGEVGTEGVTHYGAEVVVTFAVAFSSTPSVYPGALNSAADTVVGAVFWSPSTTGFKARAFSLYGQTTTGDIQWIALGA